MTPELRLSDDFGSTPNSSNGKLALKSWRGLISWYQDCPE